MAGFMTAVPENRGQSITIPVFVLGGVRKAGIERGGNALRTQRYRLPFPRSPDRRREYGL
jgi:hypothetical protein